MVVDRVRRMRVRGITTAGLGRALRSTCAFGKMFCV